MATFQEERQMSSANVVMALCGCLFVLVCVGGAIASFVFTIIFLVKDEGKGGTCADTAGQAIWTYVIVKTIVGPVSSQCFGGGSSQGEDGAKNGGETRAVSFFCLVIVTLGMLIYGGLILYSPDVCQSYKRTGLYQMYHVLYIVDAVAMIILILAYAATLCFDKGAEPRTSIAIDGIDIKVKDVVNPVSGDGSGGQAVAEPLNQ
jgi:hypothetical protein